MYNNDELLEYTKKLMDLYFVNSKDYSGNRYSERDIILFLRPTSTYRDDCISILPYDLRVGIAKLALSELIKIRFSAQFNYYKGFNGNNTYSDNSFELLFSNKGFECWVDKTDDVDEKGKPIYQIQNENFHNIFIEALYCYWDEQIMKYTVGDHPLTVNTVLETLFEFQITGRWFWYNQYNQNFLRVFLEYMKTRGYKINIFTIFNKTLDKTIREIEKGLSHYSTNSLFNVLIMIIDFYTAILDIYGEDNNKIVDRLKNELKLIFSTKLEVEKLGFMNTFLFTKKIINKYGLTVKSNKRNERYIDDSVVSYFWNNIYNDDMNPTMKRIFLDALIYTWNKSPLPKVKNSMRLLMELSTHTFYKYYGFYYNNQDRFYRDIIANANSLKKSVKTILFSKAMTEEGGLFI